MRRCVLVLVLVLVLAGCASIPTVPPEQVSVREPASAGPSLEMCVLWGERNTRTIFEGTAELSSTPWHQTIASVLVRHPRGALIIDPAFGVDVGRDIKVAPRWMGMIFGTAKGKRPILALLEDIGMKASDIRWAAVTHAHWDHVGALNDLSHTRVLMSHAEWQQIPLLEHPLEHGIMKHHFDRAGDRVDGFDFDGPPMLGFEASHDLLGDGTIIAVAMPGHTPGSAAYLVHAPDGSRWLFVGDTAWASRGVQAPVHKNPIASAIVDADREQVAKELGILHALSLAQPELHIVPAHDADAMGQLPTCTR